MKLLFSKGRKPFRTRIGHSITVLVTICCVGGISLSLFVGVGYRDIDILQMTVKENDDAFHRVGDIKSDIDRWLIPSHVAGEKAFSEMTTSIRDRATRILSSIEDLRHSTLSESGSEQSQILRRLADPIKSLLDLTESDQSSCTGNPEDSEALLARMDSIRTKIKLSLRHLENSFYAQGDIEKAQLQIARDRMDKMVFLVATIYIMLVLTVWTHVTLTTIYPVKLLRNAAKKSLREGVPFNPPQEAPEEIKDLGETVASFVNELEHRVAIRTAELQEQKADLERSIAERLRLERRAHDMALFVQVNPNPILRLNSNGNVLMVNPASEELFGRDQLELKGINIHELIPNLPKLDVDGTIEKGLVTEQIIQFDDRYYQFIFAGVSELRAIHVYGHDVTAGVLAENQQRSLEAQVRRTQRLETIGTLAGGIAHDFNNILTPILGYSEIALQKTSHNERREELEQVIHAAYRAKDLVKQILTFSRQGEEVRKPVLLTPIIKEALKLLRASIPKNIEILECIDSKCGPVDADPSQIHQVVMNICTNAYHAMQENGGVLEVSLDSCTIHDIKLHHQHELKAETYLRITIRDTGTGMDSSTLEHIFEPFFTTKQVGEGTGLGLSVVHGIMSAHQGTIQVESEPGKGTTFFIYLPHTKVEKSAEAPIITEIPRGDESILFVDDEVEIAKMGKQMLNDLGYDVTVQTSSSEALEVFRADPARFDLVITDQNMPQMVGSTLAREIRRLRDDIPVILTTGYSEMVNAENYSSWGVQALIMKPFMITETARTIRSALDGVVQPSEEDSQSPA